MEAKNLPRLIYIPLCGNDNCYSWLQKIVGRLKEHEVGYRTEHPPNGKYRNWFKHYFEECDFTIIHHCPLLWQRINALNDYMESKDDKLLLLRIVPKAQQNVFEPMESCGSIVTSASLDNFFQEMDCEMRVTDDNDVQNFVQKVIFKTSLRHESMENCKDTASEFITSYPSSSSCDDTHSLPMNRIEISEQRDLCDSDTHFEVAENFEKYYDIFGSVNDMSVFVRNCDAQWVRPEDFEHDSTSKLVEQINGLKEKDLKDMKYILHKLLPKLCQERKMVELSSVSTCKWNIFRERALVLLEFLLWENIAGQDSEIKDVDVLVRIDANLSMIMQKLREEYEPSGKETKEHIAHVSLMLLSNIILISVTTKPTLKKAQSYLHGRGSEFSNSSGSLDSSQETLKTFLSDAVRCEQIQDTASNYFQTKSHSDDPKIDYSAKKLLKESLCVQVVVLFKLLKRVFSLDKEPLKFLEDYLKHTKDSKSDWRKKGSPAMVLVLRGLVMFLTHSIRKKEGMDLKDICKRAMDVIAVAATKRNLTDEIDRSLLPLLFNSRNLIREKVGEIFEGKKCYEHKYLLNFCAKAVEQLLLPFVTEVPEISPKEAAKTLSKNKTGKQLPPEWSEFKARYALMPAQMFVHPVNTKDHKERNKSHLKERQDLHYTEILNLKKLKHDNIIEMFAFQVEKMPQFYILEDGKQRLQVALINARANQKLLEMDTLCKLLLDAVKGLRFCHDHGYVHRNLTAHSLSVFNMQSVKLSDFGLCMRISKDVAIELNSKTIPLRWSAPESIFRGEFSKQSDIWMVGHLMYEVLTHGLPPYSPFLSSDEDVVETLQKEALALPRDNCLNRKQFDLIMKCTDYHSQGRPSIEEVFTNLEEIYHTFTESPQDKIIYPDMTDEQQKSCLEISRGIPAKFCLANKLRSDSNTGVRVLNLTDVTKLTVGREIVFEEKLVHPFSSEARACIHTEYFQDILPQIKLTKSSDEEEHINCVIPSSSCSFYDLTQKRMLDTDISVYMMLIYKVADTLSQLHKLSWIIGDLRPSNVFVDKKELKPYIVSLSLLKYIGHQDGLKSDSKIEIDRIAPNRKSSAAPEVISNGLFSFASDVFCFGNFIWVLLKAFDKDKTLDEINDAEIQPFGNLTQEEQHKALRTGRWKEYNKKPLCCPDELYSLILQCVSLREADRPGMQQICEHMKRLFNEDDIKFAVSSAGLVKGSGAVLEENPSETSCSSEGSSKKSKKK